MRKTKISMDNGKTHIHCLMGNINKTTKAWEVQWGRFDDSNSNTFCFDFSHRIKGDHAGLNIHMEILRWHVSLSFYDIRHWDHINNCWEE